MDMFVQVSEDAFERLARRRASGEITDAEYGRQLDRLIVLQERVRFFRSVAGRGRGVGSRPPAR